MLFRSRDAAVISLSAALPAITADDTAIDGETQTNNIGSSNASDYTHPIYGAAKDVGTGVDGIVGTGDELTLPAYPNPEIEIDGNDHGDIFTLSGDNGIVRGVALVDTPSFNAILSTGTGSVVEDN